MLHICCKSQHIFLVLTVTERQPRFDRLQGKLSLASLSLLQIHTSYSVCQANILTGIRF